MALLFSITWFFSFLVVRVTRTALVASSVFGPKVFEKFKYF